ATMIYLARARCLSSRFGVWLQRDPLLYADGLNLSSYVENDPVNKSDPSGTATRTCQQVCQAVILTPDRELNKAGLGGIFCDGNQKCFCELPGKIDTGTTYRPGECPTADRLIESHERRHFDTSDCDPSCPGIHRGIPKPKLDQVRVECVLRRRD